MHRKESEVTPGGQRELCTESTCEQCGARFRPKNRNGLKVRFCQAKCSRDWHNDRRLAAVASLNHIKRRKPRGPSKRAQQVSQSVFMALVPVEERAELLRQAAARLGITDQDRIEAAIRRAEVPNYEATA